MHESVRRFGPKTELYVRPMFWAMKGGAGPISVDPESTQFLLCTYVSPMRAGTPLTLIGAARGGAHTQIASGHEPDVLVRLAQGERIGTLLLAKSATLAARKQWLADHLQTRGRLMLDAGAVKALQSGGKSLLPIGVHEVAGEFERGEVVSCYDEASREIARGLVNYSASETRRILRTPSSEIEAKLGYVGEPELIHRDDLVVL